MPFLKLNDLFAERYLLVELLGEGDYCELWKARDQQAGEAFVILKMYVATAGNDEWIKQAEQEFSISQQVSHPHLLKPFHFELNKDCAYQTMPYYPMGSLSRYLQEKVDQEKVVDEDKDEEEEDSVSERQIALIMSQVGSALAELHRQEPPILHLNVDPGNIVVFNEEYYFLADFGIAYNSKQLRLNLNAGVKSISQAYASPESFTQPQEVDSSSDIFSLGLTLVELCTKTSSFEGGGGKMLSRGSAAPKLPKTYSDALNEVLQACLSPNKAERPGAEELQLRAHNFLETGSWKLPEKENITQKPSSKRLYYLPAAAVFVLLSVGAYWGLLHEPAPAATYEDEKKDASLILKQQREEAPVLPANGQIKEAETIDPLETQTENRELAPDLSANERNETPDIQAEQAITRKEKPQEVSTEKEAAKGLNKEKAANEVSVVAATAPAGSSVSATTSPQASTTVSKPTPAEGAPALSVRKVSAREIEQQLNNISNPQLPEQERKAWKQKTMDQFAESELRILNETEETTKQFSPGIFLNLLYHVPHSIIIKEIKTNPDQSITEIRLKMQPKDAN